MPPKIQIWTDEKENELIFEVERRPILWDVSCEAYKRNDLKLNQWHEIALILGPSFNADMVQHRFISMKQTFMKNNRKARESRERCSGKSPDEIFKPKWNLYDKLLFLKKACAQAVSQSNLDQQLDLSNCEIEFENNTDETQLNLYDTQQCVVSNIPENSLDATPSCVIETPSCVIETITYQIF
ncbi:uncharacterized protein [Temnothorax nylanderi]|uniref:uncharacterized protein n=1 Tax=Temnothorax nylanderi TaxID=102681 RepID=UPI003A8C6BF7